jgi:fermentation-respiration switch protein FrsA (DUF1100 family)
MTLLKWLIASALIYGGVLVLMYVAQRSLMYFPETRRTPPSAAGLPQAEEVVLDTVDGEKLIAWHVAPAAGRPLVIYFQGNGGALRLRAARFRALVEAGNGLLAVSYRGYGGSTGHPSEAGLLRDAAAAHEFAARRYGHERIALWGESLGTAVAVALAAERPAARVILESPFTSAAAIAASVYWFLPVRLLIKDPFYSDRRIGKVTAPVLFIHGARDSIVPVAFGERLYALTNEPKRFVRLPAADHNDHDEHGAMEHVLGFLAGG